MFRQTFHRCPSCDTEIRQRIEDEKEVTCASCRKRFGILQDEAGGRTGLVEIEAREIPEPLYLPKGSVRALVTLLLAVSCWILVFRSTPVPAYLFSLLLTIIGYYFGFRQKVKAAESRIYDAMARAKEPLFMPPGFIRFVLIAGFCASGVWLWRRGRLGELHHLEFFAMLAGLVVGYLYARLMRPVRESSLYLLLNHLKGLVVLASAFALCALLLCGAAPDRQHVALSLSCLVTFYFGSRS